MTEKSHKHNMGFEAEVRRVAEVVWGVAPGSCQPQHYADSPGIRELDGIVRLRDISHLLMVTTSTKLAKVKEDVKKLLAAEAMERRRVPAVSKWLITETGLDAEHLDHARKNNVTALTLTDFRRRFFDGQKYITLREFGVFGSARNPADNSTTIEDDAYVPLPILLSEQLTLASQDITTGRERAVNLDFIDKAMSRGEILVLIAPFGAGKSLTAREIFKSLANKYRTGQSAMAPISLNLREHWGQHYCDEILERHARSVGYVPREDLVIAWRAGMACLILDGFDEVAAQSVIRTDDKFFMRESRRAALEGVREGLNKPHNSGQVQGSNAG